MVVPMRMHGQVSALNQKTAYRPDIDGLRAVAVLAVLAYHYGAPFPWPFVPGGFTGVDAAQRSQRIGALRLKERPVPEGGEKGFAACEFFWGFSQNTWSWQG